MSSKKFHWRSFTSVLTSVLFISIILTSLVLLVAPHGRVAMMIHWSFMGLDKEHWESFHLISGTLFLVVLILHLVLNWSPLMNYLKTHKGRFLTMKRESLLALTLGIFFTVGSIFAFPPFNAVLAFTEWAQRSWVPAREAPQEQRAQPAQMDPSQLPLSEIAYRINQPVQMLLAKLSQQGITVDSPMQSIADIAQKNNVDPRGIFMIIMPRQ